MGLLQFLLMMVMFVPLVQAQDSIVWPPEPAEALFGQRVEIIDMTLDGTAFQQARPVMVSEEYRAVITADRRVYPWPDNFPNHAGGQTVIGSDLGIENSQFSVYFSSSRNPNGEPDFLWRLDLITGIYTRFDTYPTYIDTYCGPYPYRESWHNGWVIITGVQKQQHLCHLETGQLSTPLPRDYLDWQIYNVRQSEGYVLLSAKHSDVSDASKTLFAFDILSNLLLTIGEITPVGNMVVERKLTDNLWVIATDIDGPADPTKPQTTYIVNILERRIIQVPPDGNYVTDPPRLVYRTQSETPDGMSCEVVIIDLATEKQSAYTLNAPCFAEAGNPDNREYFRVLRDNGTQADVIRVNSLTGEAIVLFTGEVEWISWISRDERYAALVLDSNGKVDTAPSQFARVSGSGDAKSVLLDLHDGSKLYETPAYPGGMAEEWMPRVYRVHNNWLALTDTQTSQLIRIEEDDFTIISVPGRIGRHLGGGWTMLWPTEALNEFGSVASFSLYNLDSQEVIPVVDLGSHADDYWLSGEFEYLRDGIFQVTIGYTGDYWQGEIPPLYDLAVYKIRIAGVEIESSE